MYSIPGIYWFHTLDKICKHYINIVELRSLSKRLSEFGLYDFAKLME